MNKVLILSLLLVSFLSSAQKHVFKSKVTKNIHMVKAQYYRWFQLYERPFSPERIKNQLDILSKDITLTSIAGQLKGEKQYKERIKIFKDWKNAHHVQDIEVVDMGDNKFILQADIKYQNIKPDGEKSSYEIHYDTLLEKYRNRLPVFTNISIKPIRNTKEEFIDAYANNRVKSLVHYWLGLMEQLDWKAKAFKEILAPKFKLNFPSQTGISGYMQFRKWFKSVPLNLKQSSHYVKNLRVNSLGGNQYEMFADFDWYGLTKDNKKMMTETKHHWLIVNNPNLRFAKIKKINISMIDPMTIF